VIDIYIYYNENAVDDECGEMYAKDMRKIAQELGVSGYTLYRANQIAMGDFEKVKKIAYERERNDIIRRTTYNVRR